MSKTYPDDGTPVYTREEYEELERMGFTVAPGTKERALTDAELAAEEGNADQ